VALRRVLPDTNVCYPISLLDLMLRLDEASLQIIWTEDLLVELEDTWVGHGIRTRADARRVCDDIRAAFVGQDVPRSEYEHLITAMPGSDPDDHVHAAAAVARAPTTIVTENVRDFPTEPMAALGVRVCRPDEYLSEVFEEEPDEVIRIVGNMAADRRQPPMTAADVLTALERAGATRFIGRVRLRLDT
jgi:hypothetical protein